MDAVKTGVIEGGANTSKIPSLDYRERTRRKFFPSTLS